MNMKNTDSKGQGAMEYLMTYSWAIMIVMIVGVALWQMGVFSGMNCTTTARGFTQVKILNPQEITVRKNGNFSGTFLNTAGVTITLQEVYWNISAPETMDTNEAYVRVPGGQVKELHNGEKLAVEAGQTFNVRAGDSSLTGATKEQTYTGEITLVYTSNIGGFKGEQTDSGTIMGCISTQ